MNNKELPQEVVNAIKGYSIGKEYAEKGAQIAHSHYLKELQAKDATIKEQAEKIEKLTGLLKDEVYKNAFTYWVKQDCTEDAAKHAAHKTLNDFKEQHGI